MRWVGHAGFETLWLETYWPGRFAAPPDDVAKARKRAEDMGFEVQALAVPVGHPTGVMPQEDLPEGWHFRRDIDGKPVPACAAITQEVIADARNAAETLRQLGFQRVFWDDDLRQGNHEGDIQGCFCGDCLAEFARKFPQAVPEGLSRATLRPGVRRDPAGLTNRQMEIRNAWMRFQSDRVISFLTGVSAAGLRNGIMVMHNGDERHGIDLPEIVRAVPDCMIRVGEMMFDDASFQKPENRQSLIRSILKHRRLAGGDPRRLYTETGVYPCDRLSPENLIRKIELERACGMENVFVMSIDRMSRREYYDLLCENRARLEAIERARYYG